MTDRAWIADVRTRWTPRLLSVLRVVAVLLYLSHGASKIFGYPAPPGPGAHTVPFLSLYWFAGMIELGGGTLLLLGLFTRPVAFVLAGEMAVAYFKVHAPRAFWPLVNHGEIVVLFCFLWLYLAAAGGGAWSLDALRSRGRGPAGRAAGAA